MIDRRSRSGLRLAVGLATLGVVGAWAPSPLEAQSGRPQAREGNRLYQEGRFDEAHRKYLEALAEDPDSPLLRFNDGNALYQSGDYEGALQAYVEALENGDPGVVAPAWYNLGNTLFRQQQLEQSLDAYKESLRRNPRDLDAKHNLERVLELMQEQEEEQQGEDGEQNEGEQNEDEQNQDEQNQDEQNEDQPDQGDEPEDPEQQEGEEDQPQDQPEEQDQPPEQEPQEGEAQPQPEPGEMTAEEAERLLDAIDENPEDVNRKPVSARGRLPRKPW